MNSYDPNQAPDANEWNALDEGVRALLVEQYHKRKRVSLPNMAVHALFHVIVENQIALGDATNVPKTLERLIAEGLDRHDAVHAIGAVLLEHMQSAMSGKAPAFGKKAYASDLDALTAEKWRAWGETED